MQSFVHVISKYLEKNLIRAWCNLISATNEGHSVRILYEIISLIS